MGRRRGAMYMHYGDAQICSHRSLAYIINTCAYTTTDGERIKIFLVWFKRIVLISHTRYFNYMRCAWVVEG